jgi:hypothetical protein
MLGCIAMETPNFFGILNPPTLEEFQKRVSCASPDSLRMIRRDSFINAMSSGEWVPHFEFVENSMRERGISF